MNSTTHPFNVYAGALLPFHPPLEAGALAASPLLDQEQTNRAVGRMLRVLGRSKDEKQKLVLLGLGEGFFAREMAAALPQGIELVVAELSPQRVHTFLKHKPAILDWLIPAEGRHLLFDSSPWSLLLLLQAWGGLGNCVPLRNPELPQGGAPRYGLLQKILAMAKEERALPPESPGAPSSLSIAAILRPNETGLEDFFGQFPSEVAESGCMESELAVVWDAQEPPDQAPPSMLPVRQSARPLGGDFGAQRNAMLSLCRGDWILYLDADERLPRVLWELLPSLLSRRDVEGYWLPRRTFYPDEKHALAGMGLWPDLQLRLFRNRPGLKFVNRVHERLQGVDGRVGILPGVAIRHLNQVQKNSEEIEAKYALFNQAGEGAGVKGHKRSKDYPHLPVSFFDEMERRVGADALLTLRYNPGK